MSRLITVTILTLGVAATGASAVLAQSNFAVPPIAAVCNHHMPKVDCHIHDRSVYLAMTIDKPDQRTQPHAWTEYREQERLARRGGRS